MALAECARRRHGKVGILADNTGALAGRHSDGHKVCKNM